MMTMKGSQGIVIVFLALVFTTSAGLPDLKSFFDALRGVKAEKPIVEVEAQEAHSRQKRQGSGDSSIYPHEIDAPALPLLPNGSLNTRYMPITGNGHISSAIYSGEVFLNGLFNGAGAESHRALIPAVNMFKVKFDPVVEAQTRRQYKFNAMDGYYHEEITCPYADIDLYIYAHQTYVRVLVAHVYAKRRNDFGGIIPFEYIHEDIMDTPDINFQPPRLHNNVNWMTTGQTRESETGDVTTDNVHVYYHSLPQTINVANRDEDYATIVMSVDKEGSSAMREFDDVARLIATQGHDELLRRHIEAWRSTWARGRVEVTGEDLRLSKVTWFSQYYLLSSLPSIYPIYPLPYTTLSYGISRTSLGRGKANSNYRGHMFWDTEMYIMPPLILTHPDLVKAMMRYRWHTATEAREHAQDMDAEGYRFPWESGFTGRDVTPDSCIECREKQLHVTGAVAWAARQYFGATHDLDYLKNQETNGCDLMREIARFFQSIATYNEVTASYDINDVSGPDDWHPNVNNNAYTNVQACLAIHWARYIACQCDRNQNTEVPDEWIQKAMYMSLPYDNEKRLHYQHDGYGDDNNDTIKQADTILLTFPVNWNTSVDIMKNDLYYYALQTSQDTPAMTHSFMAGGFQYLNEFTKMLEHFDKSHLDYIAEPYKIWTEYSEGSGGRPDSSVNFLPGAGGFLQSLIYGFGGVRIRPEFMEFHHPTPPPKCVTMTFFGFDYLGANLTIEITHSRVVIDCHDIGEHTLIVRRNTSYVVDEPLLPGGRIEIDEPSLGFWIMADRGFPCEHPRDHIYMPWGYHPWTSTAPHAVSNHAATWTVVILWLTYQILPLT